MAFMLSGLSETHILVENVRATHVLGVLNAVRQNRTACPNSQPREIRIWA